MFIFIIQFLWKYIDDLVGKGLESSIIIKLIVYFSAFMVPTVLPLAILLSSVMTMGSLAEHIELVAFKSAGISLYRILRGLFIIIIMFALASLFFSNTLIPKANLGFYTTLNTIRNTKLALNFKPGMFNSDLNGISIKIGSKSKDQSRIYDVMLYDHTSGYGADNVVLADSGHLYTTKDGKYLVLKLYNGQQFQEVPPKQASNSFEHLRTSFNEYEKLVDLSSFKTVETNKDIYKTHRAMLSFAQLSNHIDSMQKLVEVSSQSINKFSETYIDFLHAKKYYTTMPNPNSLNYKRVTAENFQQKEALNNRVKNMFQNLRNYISMIKNDTNAMNERIAKARNEYHTRFMLSFACILLFLVGAPMGAIIKKGGLGMPMLVSIIFFVIFFVLNTIGSNLSEKQVISPLIGVWFSTYILLPFALFMLYRSNKDIANFDFGKQWFENIKKRFTKN
jgi:lipopolysaccharide export system permease protein